MRYRIGSFRSKDVLDPPAGMDDNTPGTQFSDNLKTYLQIFIDEIPGAEMLTIAEVLEILDEGSDGI